MARLRYNGLATGAAGSTVGLTLGASLTNSATSVTFSAALTHSNGTAVPTIAGSDYIPLSILDANGHVSEIVWLTAYTAAATTGTIARGKEGTTGVAHSSGDKVIQGPTALDVTLAYPPGSADAPPATPNAKDDEFDGASSVSWTNTPTAPTTWNINSTAAGCGYLRSNGNGTAFIGVYQAIPGSYPFTITTRVNSNRRGFSNLGLGLFLAPASPTGSSAILWIGPEYINSTPKQPVQRLNYSSFATTTFVSAATADGLQNWAGSLYLRIVATSATNIKTQASTDGFVWHTLDAALNPPFTPGVMGLALSENGTADLEGVADFFRVT